MFIIQAERNTQTRRIYFIYSYNQWHSQGERGNQVTTNPNSYTILD